MTNEGTAKKCVERDIREQSVKQNATTLKGCCITICLTFLTSPYAYLSLTYNSR